MHRLLPNQVKLLIKTCHRRRLSSTNFFLSRLKEWEQDVSVVESQPRTKEEDKHNFVSFLINKNK